MLGGLGYRSLASASKRLATIGVVNSMTDLRAQAIPSTTVAVIMLGYGTPGDGGGGVYWWNAADTTADNGGTVIQVDAGGVGRFNKLF